jgi:hypothetical protein
MANGTIRGQQWYIILSPRATATSREYISPFRLLGEIPERLCPRLVLRRDNRAKACDCMESQMTAKKTQ